MKRLMTIMAALIMAATFSLSAEAQTFGGPDFMRKKVVLGGTFGAGFSGNYFHLGVAPQVGYRLTRSLEAGLRIGYDLNYYSRTPTYGNYCAHYISGAAYVNMDIFHGIYVHVEDEEMCQLISGAAITTSQRWFNSIMVGGGYRQYYNGGNFVYYSILYNLSWDYSSPYASPFVIRLGYCSSL